MADNETKGERRGVVTLLTEVIKVMVVVVFMAFDLYINMR